MVGLFAFVIIDKGEVPVEKFTCNCETYVGWLFYIWTQWIHDNLMYSRLWPPPVPTRHMGKAIPDPTEQPDRDLTQYFRVSVAMSILINEWIGSSWVAYMLYSICITWPEPKLTSLIGLQPNNPSFYQKNKKAITHPKPKVEISSQY